MAQLIELSAESLHVVGEASGRVHRILGGTAGTDLHARHTWQRHRSHPRSVDRPERGGAQAALRQISSSGATSATRFLPRITKQMTRRRIEFVP